ALFRLGNWRKTRKNTQASRAGLHQRTGGFFVQRRIFRFDAELWTDGGAEELDIFHGGEGGADEMRAGFGDQSAANLNFLWREQARGKMDFHGPLVRSLGDVPQF